MNKSKNELSFWDEYSKEGQLAIPKHTPLL